MMCASCHAQQYLKIVSDRYELKRWPHRNLPMKSQKYSGWGGGWGRHAVFTVVSLCNHYWGLDLINLNCNFLVICLDISFNQFVELI